MHAQGLMLLSGILLAGMGCQWIAWRMKLPAILFLLICGILAGPVLGWLNPDDLFGDLLFPFISLSVAVILFEGGLTLKFREIRGIEAVIRRLITFGMGITWVITALAVHWLLDFPWELAFLFGAIMVVTGPTVIVPMLRSVRPREHLANILRWEGILIDPIGATLAVLVHQFIVTEAAQGELLASITVFGKILAIGFVLGGSAGYFFGTALRRHWVPLYLHNFTTLALVCGIFGLSDMLEPESGLLAVTVMGIWLANMEDVHLDEILDFKESLSLVLISMLFIVLAARLDGQAFLALGWSSLVVFGIIQFVSRPVTAQIAAIGSKLTMSERHLLAWIAPRGIVAAAISALFAIRLESAGFPEASQMVPLAFLVIIGTVLLQSLTAGPLARWLKVAEPEPTGFLIVGADRLARTIGEALQKNGLRVVLADQAWDNINAANMQGLRTYWGNVASIHADRHLNLSGIGSLLALSPSTDLNALAAKHYRMEFEPKNIYAIRNQEETTQAIQEKAAIQQGGQPLFRETLTRNALCGFLSEGAEVKTTLLTEKFTFEDYLKKSREHRIPLFAIDPGETIYPLTPKQKIAPEADWKIIGLTLKKPMSEEQAEEFLPEDA